MFSRRFVVGAALIGGLALTTSGCSLITPQKPVAFTQTQLKGALGTPTVPSGFTWNAGTSDGDTVADTLKSAQDWWDENDGTPQSCFDAYATSYLANSTESGAALQEPDWLLGSFDDNKGADHYRLLSVGARLFPDAKAAQSYVNGLNDAVNACPSGYTLRSSTSKTYWTTKQFTFNEEPSLGTSNVRAVAVEELVTKDTSSAGYRTVILERGNAVVAVIAEVNGGEPVRYTEQDQIAKAAASALGGIKAS